MDSSQAAAGRHWLLNLALLFSVAAFIAGCGGGGGGGSSQSTITSNTAINASVAQVIQVSPELASAPFDTPKIVNTPPGFKLRLLARVEGARFMALAPNGDILVSYPGGGTITLIRQNPQDGTTQQFEFASGLTRPHDMVFHQIGGVTYLYIAESNQVTRAVYVSGDTHLGTQETIVANLPDESSPELRGTYNHQLKNIALSPDHHLYVSIASACNACEEDTVSDPVRGAIYQYNADGTNPQLFARGLRNAEGLDFLPGTNDLWVTVNNRDEIKYPFNNDFDGDGSIDYDKIIPTYVDQNPPEPFTKLRAGGNYGWPFCNSLPNASMSNLDLIADVDFNADGSKLDCSTVDRASKGIRAHSAPLGFSFLHNSVVPEAYRKGAVVALHGCWNCTRLDAGYKVVYFPFDDAGNAGAEIDLVSGFVTDPDERTLWGRPVDVIADAYGGILISDDFANAIYRLEPSP